MEGTGPNPDRQEQAHPHQVYFYRHDATGGQQEVLIPDLGSDKTLRFTKNKEGIWEKAGEIIYADLDIGPGKRCRKLHSLPQPGSKCLVHFGGFFGGAVVVLGDSHPPGGAGRGRGPWLWRCDEGSRLLFGIPLVILS